MRRRYLFGPVNAQFAAEKLKSPREAGDCLAFDASPGVDLRIEFGDTWEQVCSRLPDGWHPDFIALYLPYATIPTCLWNAPIPIVALAGDWNLQWHYYRRRASSCDLILTDATGVETYARAGFEQARQAVIFGGDRTLFEFPWPSVERDIDVLFVGNFNPAVQRERLPWLARLADLPGRKVVLATGLFGDDYRRLLARTKIVFNRSIRGECNIRAFEAAAAGTLLFQEQDNREVPALFGDRQECVYYRDDNLETLLGYYLDHEEERRVLATAARAKVGEYRFERLWDRQIELVEKEWDALVKRTRERLARSSVDIEELLTRTWQALCAGLKDDPNLLGDLGAAATDAGPEAAALHNALGLVAAKSNQREERFSGELATIAVRHFRAACASDPEGAVYGLNLAEALLGTGDLNEATEQARRALGALESQPLRREDTDFAHFPPLFDPFRVEWENAGWVHVGSQEEELKAKADLLRWRLHLLLGELTGEVCHFESAAAARPDVPATQAALGCALGRAGKPAEAAKHLLQAVAGNPFDRVAARALFQAFGELGDGEGCRQLIASRRRLSQAAPQLVAPEPWFTPSPPANTEVREAKAGWLRTIDLDELHRRFGTLDTTRALCGFTNATDTHVVLTLFCQTNPRKRVLEVGTAAGHMTANLTEWTEDDAAVFTLGITTDLPATRAPAQRVEDPPREAFGRLSNHFQKAHKVFFITADSLTYDFRRLAPLDFVFVDGAHDLPHVVSDTLKAYEVLRPGGFLVWHDFTSPADWVEVRPALERLRFQEPVYHVSGTAVAFLQKAGSAAVVDTIAQHHHGSTPLNGASRKVAVTWEGAQRAIHSLALVNRRVCTELIARGHDVSLLASGQAGVAERGPHGSEPPPPYQIAEPDRAPLLPSLEESLFRPLKRSADVHVRHQWPPQLTPPSDGRWIMFQPWEFGSPPKSWATAIHTAVDEVWVPSHFVRNGFIAGGIPAELVRVIPSGIDCEQFHPGALRFPLQTTKGCKFLFVGGTIYRKGIDVLLDAYTRAFTADDDVCLVIKDMGVGTFYRGQTAEARIAELRDLPNSAAIEYLTEDLGDADLAGLYTACDCLVHPYRGEGFGLPIAEAMACGLPVMVTNQGAALDFCDRTNAYLIPARTTYFPENRVGDLETVGRPWLAEPDRDMLIDLLRHVAKNEKERRWKGERGREKIAGSFTWKHTADAVESRLTALVSKPIRRFARPTGSGPVTAGVGRPTISLCMIVKNEEDNLPACLGPLADLVDEMIVVDTGSTDRTKKMAIELGAQVFDFPWVDSFSAARNESLRHASGDWIFWMDADDRVDEENRDKLKTLFTTLRNENVAYVMKCACVPQERSGTTTVVDHVRLFRNHPELRWEYRVHEQILPSLRRAGTDVRWSNVVIKHVGYQDPSLRKRKLERDLRLLGLEDAEKPDDPFTLFNLGSVYQELGQVPEAVVRLQRSLERSHPSDSIVRKLYALLSQCHRQLGQKALSLAAAQKGREFYPDDVELLFHEGLSRRELGDFNGAEASWLRLLQPTTSEHFASVDAGLAGYKSRHNLAILYQEMNRLPDAEQQWRLALEQQPQFLPALFGLGEICLVRERWAECEAMARRVEDGGAPVDASILRARAHLARKEFSETRAICEAAIARAPQAMAPWRFLSHALLQEGRDSVGAERALKAILDLAPDDVEARNNLAVLLRERKNSLGTVAQ